MGLTLLVDEPWRLPQLNAVCVPAGVDEAAVRLRLLEQFNLELGGGLGALAGKVWRIGLMGYSARRRTCCCASRRWIRRWPGSRASGPGRGSGCAGRAGGQRRLMPIAEHTGEARERFG
jgi:hypothetical protein